MNDIFGPIFDALLKAEADTRKIYEDFGVEYQPSEAIVSLQETIAKYPDMFPSEDLVVAYLNDGRKYEVVR